MTDASAPLPPPRSSSRRRSTPRAGRPAVAGRRAARPPPRRRLSSPWASLAAIVIAILWTIPTFGLLDHVVPAAAGRSGTSGWWTLLCEPRASRSRTTRRRSSAASTSLATYFVNSIVITIPAVIIPITLALLAAYAFAWIDFKGRDVLFVAVFALQIVPIQVTLIPLLSHVRGLGHRRHRSGRSGSSHTIFALPLAIFLLHNFMKEIPASLVEAARVDGAGHVKIFFQVLLPLLMPGDRGVRDLPVPVGVERPAGRADVRRRDHRRGAADGARWRSSAGTRGVAVAPAVRRRVHRRSSCR